MPRKTAKKQISLDFDEITKCLRELEHEESNSADVENGSAEAVVLSFSDKLAQKEQENETRLYQGILSRIKHLDS